MRADSDDASGHSRSPATSKCTGIGGRKVLILGAGTYYLSAMSYYTTRIVNALAADCTVAFVPMRKLIPRWLYPGRARVGTTMTSVGYDEHVEVFRGMDWHWSPRQLWNVVKIVRWKPDYVVCQWWTGAVLHTYLLIAAVSRLVGARVIIEFHEVLDTGEERIPLARMWAGLWGKGLIRVASAFVIHSEADRVGITSRYGLASRPCVVIPHGPLDHHASDRGGQRGAEVVLREAPDGAVNVLFFGLIRPYKGLEDLVRAFDLLGEDEVEQFWLTVVGETWEGWTLPVELISQSRYRKRMTLVNRFVDDEEVIGHFAGADAVVLPYHRSSASSPAHVAMSNGLPLVITAVGGLPEAVADYGGAHLVPPHDPEAIRDALRLLPALRGQRFDDPHSWDRTVRLYGQLMASLEQIEGPSVVPAAPSPRRG